MKPPPPKRKTSPQEEPPTTPEWTTLLVGFVMGLIMAAGAAWMGQKEPWIQAEQQGSPVRHADDLQPERPAFRLPAKEKGGQ